jgi:hypothetical protein
VIAGAASPVYVNAPEARLLARIEPTADRWVKTHADGLVAMLVPHAPRGVDVESTRRRAASGACIA